VKIPAGAFYYYGFIVIKNSLEGMLIWNEVHDAGRRKDRWDGNGSEKEWDVKREKECRNKHF